MGEVVVIWISVSWGGEEGGVEEGGGVEGGRGECCCFSCCCCCSCSSGGRFWGDSGRLGVEIGERKGRMKKEREK